MNDTKQPEALRLADALEDDLQQYDGLSLPRISQDVADKAAAELRRLHAANVDCTDWYEAIKADYEALRKAVAKLHAAKGRYHTQIATCDLYDLLGLKNERPAK